MDHTENQKPRPLNESRAKVRLNFFVSWMNKLAAAYRQPIPTATQAMYLDSLDDLPLDRLELAFARAVRECKFLPSIAELRSFENDVTVPVERLEAAHQRLRERLAAQPAVETFRRALDGVPKSRQAVAARKLAPAEYAEYCRKLKAKARPSE